MCGGGGGGWDLDLVADVEAHRPPGGSWGSLTALHTGQPCRPCVPTAKGGDGVPLGEYLRGTFGGDHSEKQLGQPGDNPAGVERA